MPDVVLFQRVETVVIEKEARCEVIAEDIFVRKKWDDDNGVCGHGHY